MKNTTHTHAHVTEKEAIEILNSIVGSPFLGITQRTYPKLTKKDRTTGMPAKFSEKEIAKISELTVKVGSSYIKRVLNQLNREGKKSSEYKQGLNTNPLTKLAKNGVVGLNKFDNIQIEYGTLKNVKPVTKYVNVVTGDEIKKSEIGDILPAHSKPQNQGSDIEVQVRKVNLKNIIDFTFKGKKYIIVR